ncbi:MAG: YicC/YloC family endoribonuclease [Bacteroidota bacterium]
MLYSMTGYGKAEKSYQNKKISVELKSLNSKYCDINVKIPYHLREKELEIRKVLNNQLQRGKINCMLAQEVSDEEKASTINSPVVKNYVKQIQEISKDINLEFSPELLRAALQMPEALEKYEEELGEEEWNTIFDTLQNAIDDLNSFRKQEGEAMEKDFEERIGIMSKYLKDLEPFEQRRIDKVRERLHEKFTELKGEYDIDENRFEQEVVYYLEKFDITEEKVRLQNHFDYFLEMMKQPVASGKKLNFIAQEMGREINTIGSKASDMDIQKIVVQLKDELEKIKEQLMNVL